MSHLVKEALKPVCVSVTDLFYSINNDPNSHWCDALRGVDAIPFFAIQIHIHIWTTLTTKWTDKLVDKLDHIWSQNVA